LPESNLLTDITITVTLRFRFLAEILEPHLREAANSQSPPLVYA
jgi:hypothetical protein